MIDKGADVNATNLNGHKPIDLNGKTTRKALIEAVPQLQGPSQSLTEKLTKLNEQLGMLKAKLGILQAELGKLRSALG